MAVIESVRQEKLIQKLKNKKEEEIKIDPEIEKEAKSISKDPILFKKRIDVVNQAGVVGERSAIAMYMCALDSRLLPENPASPNVLAVKNAGHFGAGKSYTLMMCLQIYPESAYHLMTNGSAKCLYYLQEGLKHKALIVTEGFQYQTKNAEDSELVYATRSLISEGMVRYHVVEKDDEGRLITTEKEIEGPTSFITTTIMDKLEPQLEDRLFTVHPNESSNQTKDIVTMTANQKAGKIEDLDSKIIDSWKAYHKSLKPVEVIIPFAPEISNFITKSTVVPISVRRAFKRVLIVIQTVACSYQYQRERDDKNRIIAEIADYWMALQIVQDAFRENMGKESKKTEEYLTEIKMKGQMTQKELSEKFGVSGPNISSWAKEQINEGILTWCREDGSPFIDDKALKKAKHSGKAFLTIVENYSPPNISGLPTPYELTKDSRWNIDGELLKQYDLELEKKTTINQVLTPYLNTSYKKEPVDNIEYFNYKDECVKVLIPEDIDKKLDDISDELLAYHESVLRDSCL